MKEKGSYQKSEMSCQTKKGHGWSILLSGRSHSKKTTFSVSLATRTFWKRQNYNDNEKISGYQKFRGEGGRDIQVGWGRI